ncbi:MAG: LegC family aminotransferase [Selenomonadaceae bacterium]|nr:LegC family aminotransferase [Selenomonadaceae bacterium]
MTEQEKFLIDDIRARLSSVLPTEKFVPLHEPYFVGNEKNYVDECIETGWVSSVGKFVDRFEHDLAEYTGVKRAVAVANGTSALHICLVALDVRPGDEILVPALTFIATANAVAYCGAVPHFVDSAYDTLGLDPIKLDAYLADISEMRGGVCYNRSSGRRIYAVIPMHTFGHSINNDGLAAVTDKYNLIVVEDCAESIGSKYKGVHTGNFGKVAALSFNGNKTITTGGGGAVLTNDVELGKFIKHLTTQAKLPHRWEFSHDHIGYNYRMPNINAALGCAQLEQIDRFIARKRALADRYKVLFDSADGVKFFVEPPFDASNYWLNVLMLDPEHAHLRDELLAELNDHNIMARPVWNLMYTMPMYADCPRMNCNVAEDICRRLVNIPSSVSLIEDC